MKRKIGIIIAVLLCVVLVFTFVACGNKEGTTDNTTTEQEGSGGNTGDSGSGGNGGSTSDSSISAADQAEMQVKIETYISEWIESHAEAEGEVTDQSALFTSGLGGQNFNYNYTEGKKRVVDRPSFRVTFDAASETYTVVATWKKADSKTFTVKAKTVHYADWAGRKIDEYDPLTGEVGEALDAVIKAGIHTANVVTGTAPTGQFSAKATIGGDVMGHAYGLLVKGNIDLAEPTNTEFGIVVINEETGREFVGIYYVGAAKVEESKIYLQYQDEFIYMNYADFSSLLGKIPTEEEAGDGALSKFEGKGLEGFLGENATMVSGIIGTVLDGYENDDGYLFDINLGAVIPQVSSIISKAGIDVSDYIPEFITNFGLDIGTMKGLQGHISIAVDLSEDKDMVTGVEVAINIPECTFFLNDEATDADEKVGGIFGVNLYKNSNPDSDKQFTKIDIPAMGIALFVKDFVFSTEEAVDVLPEAATEAKYFSVGNIDTSLDVTVNGYTYRAHLVTDVNPFEIWKNGMDSNARAALVIRESEGETFDADHDWNFLTVTYEQKYRTLTVSGTFFNLGDDGEQIYTLELTGAEEVLAEIEHWLGIDNWIGLESDETYFVVVNDEKDNGPAKPSAHEIFNDPLVKEILAYVVAAMSGEEEAEETATIGEDVMGYVDTAKGLYGEIQELYAKLQEDGVITIGDDSFSADVDPDVINEVIDFINAKLAGFGVDFEIPHTSEPESVIVRVNTEGYEDTAYIEVVVNKETYKLTCATSDGFTLNFTYVKESGRSYIFDFSADGKSVTFGANIYPAKENEEDEVEPIVLIPQITLSNFKFSWGWDTTETIEAMLPTHNAETGAIDGSELIFKADGTGPATSLVHGILKNLNKESIKPYVAEGLKKVVDLVFDKFLNNATVEGDVGEGSDGGEVVEQEG